MSTLIHQAIADHRQALDLLSPLVPAIEACAHQMASVFGAGKKLLICGNGGSAADAQHLASELTGRFERDRPGFPAIALTTDSSALTAIGNDYGFERVFARQIESLASPGDLLITISTSGQSSNLLAAVAAAKAKGLHTVALSGRDGGPLAKAVGLAITVEASRTSRIQEMHVLILHLLCELLDSNCLKVKSEMPTPVSVPSLE
jgi:D-sedoheptulose 7-phosphate isomerase